MQFLKKGEKNEGISHAHGRLHHDQLPLNWNTRPGYLSIDPEHLYTHVFDNWPTQNPLPGLTMTGFLCQSQSAKMCIGDYPFTCTSISKRIQKLEYNVYSYLGTHIISWFVLSVDVYIFYIILCFIFLIGFPPFRATLACSQWLVHSRSLHCCAISFEWTLSFDHYWFYPMYGSKSVEPPNRRKLLHYSLPNYVCLLFKNFCIALISIWLFSFILFLFLIKYKLS